ncbi:MAG: deoxyribose-phosphate aldolase [Thermoleophilia bacterium]
MHAEELAKTIDHTLLQPDATRRDIERLCQQAAEYHFAAVCVLPHWVGLCGRLLSDSDVKVCTVVGFPFGADGMRSKVVAAEEAVAHGADEIDVVMCLPAMLSGDFTYVRDELTGVVRAVRMAGVNNGRGLVLVKVIVETCYLSNKLKKMACRIVEDTGADFVKTSTGLGPAGATVHDVELLRDALSERVAVKASGGVRTYGDVLRLINAGAARVGTSAGDEIMREFFAAQEAG